MFADHCAAAVHPGAHAQGDHCPQVSTHALPLCLIMLCDDDLREARGPKPLLHCLRLVYNKIDLHSQPALFSIMFTLASVTAAEQRGLG